MAARAGGYLDKVLQKSYVFRNGDKQGDESEVQRQRVLQRRAAAQGKV
jgi:hypothetical protein